MPGRGAILVIDPRAEVLAVTRLMLTRRRFDVLTAGDPDEALAMLAGGAAVIAVVSEGCLPGMCACEWVRRLRHAAPHAALVIMSGCLDKPLAESIEFLHKPFTASQLEERVEAALARRPAAAAGVSAS